MSWDGNVTQGPSQTVCPKPPAPGDLPAVTPGTIPTPAGSVPGQAGRVRVGSGWGLSSLPTPTIPGFHDSPHGANYSNP